MVRKIRESRWLYVVLSIVMAIAFWMYVRVETDPDATKPIHNISVSLQGEDVLEARGLMVSATEPGDVDLTLKGSVSVINNITNRNITVVLDVSKITEAGDYDLDYTVGLPTNVSASSVTVMDKLPTAVHVSIATLYSKEIKVTGSFSGSIADGYQAGEFEITPMLITVSGEENMVDQVDHAVVLLETDEELSETYTGELPFVLVNAKGAELSDFNLRTSVNTVEVTLPVVMVRDIPLTVDLIAGGGATADHVTVKITPDIISVAGTEEDILPLTKISLGQIDLSKIVSTDVLTYPITLDSALTNVSGLEQATVSITIDGLTTDVLSSGNIELINIPNGYSANAITQSLDVQIRGPEDVVATIVSSQLRIVADLSGSVSGKGRYTLPVKVYLDGNSAAGVVGEYTIVVAVTKK